MTKLSSGLACGRREVPVDRRQQRHDDGWLGSTTLRLVHDRLMFRHRLQLRRWAARVLLLWLFGVGVGVANACVLAIGVGTAQGATFLQDSAHAAPAASSGEHHGARAGMHEGAGDRESAPGSSNCKDFCDKTGVSVPPQKSSLDGAHGHALPPAVIAVIRPIEPPSPVALRRPDRDRHSGLPPITIAFLRLAL